MILHAIQVVVKPIKKHVTPEFSVTYRFNASILLDLYNVFDGTLCLQSSTQSASDEWRLLTPITYDFFKLLRRNSTVIESFSGIQ